MLDLQGNRHTYTDRPGSPGRSGLLVPSDTVTFTYDVAGYLTQTRNRWARVTRTYHPNGWLAADTIRLASAASAGFAYGAVHGLRFEYDAVGRRDTLANQTSMESAVTWAIWDGDRLLYERRESTIHKTRRARAYGGAHDLGAQGIERGDAAPRFTATEELGPMDVPSGQIE